MLSGKKRILLISLLVMLLAVTGFMVMNNPDILDTLRRTDLTIRWTTESELDIVGFNLFRSDTPDGKFVKINEELIPPAPDPFVGGEHVFIDKGVIRGQTYYYQLETVTRRGNTTIRGPFAIPAGN
jgi:hypothetical protein